MKCNNFWPLTWLLGARLRNENIQKVITNWEEQFNPWMRWRGVNISPNAPNWHFKENFTRKETKEFYCRFKSPENNLNSRFLRSSADILSTPILNLQNSPITICELNKLKSQSKFQNAINIELLEKKTVIFDLKWPHLAIWAKKK